uniref:C2H2-type domain-containing protein n=1 Tax=Equus asinus TaxID=9793 RepID=A0A9L0KJF0_EQUAS
MGSSCWPGNQALFTAIELAATARECSDRAEPWGNWTSGSQGSPRSALDCGVVPPERPFLVWPGQPADREMLLGLQSLCSSGSGPGEEESPARINCSAIPKALECRECGLTAAYFPDLIHHQSSHAGDKPHCC